LVKEVSVLTVPTLQHHENIIQLLAYGFGTELGDNVDEDLRSAQPFLLVELATQGSMREFLAAHPSMDNSDLRDLFLDVSSGLEALHACGVVHGDLKLDNILVCQDSRGRFTAKLSDFSHSITSKVESTYLGTEKYMPPELFGIQVKPIFQHEQLLACDMWCLGVCIFEALVGKDSDTAASWQHSPAELILDDDDLVAKLSLLPVDRFNLWTKVLQSLLHTEPMQRANARCIRSLLDAEAGKVTPSVGAVDDSILSFLEVSAPNLIVSGNLD